MTPLWGDSSVASQLTWKKSQNPYHVLEKSCVTQQAYFSNHFLPLPSHSLLQTHQALYLCGSFICADLSACNAHSQMRTWFAPSPFSHLCWNVLSAFPYCTYLSTNLSPFTPIYSCHLMHDTFCLLICLLILLQVFPHSNENSMSFVFTITLKPKQCLAYSKYSINTC